MNNKFHFTKNIVTILVLIFVFVGCDNGTTSDNDPTPFEGTWTLQGSKVQYKFKGNNFSRTSGWRGDDFKGSFSYSKTQLNIKWIENYDEIFERWQPEVLPIRSTVDYILNGDTLVLSNNLIEGKRSGWHDLNGTWRR